MSPGPSACHSSCGRIAVIEGGRAAWAGRTAVRTSGRRRRPMSASHSRGLGGGRAVIEPPRPAGLGGAVEATGRQLVIVVTICPGNDVSSLESQHGVRVRRWVTVTSDLYRRPGSAGQWSRCKRRAGRTRLRARLIVSPAIPARAPGAEVSNNPLTNARPSPRPALALPPSSAQLLATVWRNLVRSMLTGQERIA